MLAFSALNFTLQLEFDPPVSVTSQLLRKGLNQVALRPVCWHDRNTGRFETRRARVGYDTADPRNHQSGRLDLKGSSLSSAERG